MSAASSSVRCRRFAGKVALVTASTAGIGQEIARRLGLEGATVVVSSRKAPSVEETVRQLQAEGVNAAGLACHVGDKAALEALVMFVVERFGRIDVLVSNAAVNPAAGPITEMEDSAIEKIIDINVKSAAILTKLAVPHMPSGSSIVFVSSYTAFSPNAPIAMYAVSKTALLGLTKALAEELGPQKGIRVNCIAPGVVPTKFAGALVASDELSQLHKDRTFLGRLGTAEDMAAAVAFLASNDASYITGETLVVAGGMQSRL